MNDARWPGLWITMFVGACLAGCERPVDGEAAGTTKASDVEDATGDEAGIEWRESLSGDGNWLVAWRPTVATLPVSEPFSVEVRVADANGARPDDDVQIFLDAEMPHHGHGMNVIPRVTEREESWLVEGILMHMPGRWELSVDVIGEDETERAQWTVQLER
ncbi:MAG: hypothetical protein P8J59_08235 [Phycisphaerales bacterium]|jgi:hypothetical protein|nr:hypothetical protein [Phycisphaerales bacterium]